LVLCKLKPPQQHSIGDAKARIDSALPPKVLIEPIEFQEYTAEALIVQGHGQKA